MTTSAHEFEEKLNALGVGEGWRWEKGSWWLEPNAAVRAIATKMIALDARFIAITAMERPDKEIRLDYQWDLEGQLLSFITATQHNHIASIADLIPGADWGERETHEYFAVEFTGRESTKPLMTRPGDAVGINLRPEEAAS